MNLAPEEQAIVDEVREMDSTDVESNPGVAFELLAIIERRVRHRVTENSKPTGIFGWLGIRTETP